MVECRYRLTCLANFYPSLNISLMNVCNNSIESEKSSQGIVAGFPSPCPIPLLERPTININIDLVQRSTLRKMFLLKLLSLSFALLPPPRAQTEGRNGNRMGSGTPLGPMIHAEANGNGLGRQLSNPELTCGGRNEVRCTKCFRCDTNGLQYDLNSETSKRCATNPKEFGQGVCPADRPYCYIVVLREEWIPNSEQTISDIRVKRGCSEFYYNSYTDKDLVCRAIDWPGYRRWRVKYGSYGSKLCNWGHESNPLTLCRCNPFAAGDGCNGFVLPAVSNNQLTGEPNYTGPTYGGLNISNPKPYVGTWMSRTTMATQKVFPKYSTQYPLYIHPDPRKRQQFPRPNGLSCYICPTTSANCAAMTNSFGTSTFAPGARTPPAMAPLTHPPEPKDLINDDHKCPEKPGIDLDPTEAYPEFPTLPPSGYDVEAAQCTGQDNVCSVSATMDFTGTIQAIRGCSRGKVGCFWGTTARGHGTLNCTCAWNFCNGEVIDRVFMASPAAPSPPPPLSSSSFSFVILTIAFLLGVLVLIIP